MCGVLNRKCSVYNLPLFFIIEIWGCCVATVIFLVLLSSWTSPDIKIKKMIKFFSCDPHPLTLYEDSEHDLIFTYI